MKCRIVLCLAAVLILGASAPRAVAGAKVTESDLKAYRAVEYAKAVDDARHLLLRGAATKTAPEAGERPAALRAAGWTEERYGEVADAIAEVSSTLRSIKDGEITGADVASTLAEYDATTVATVKAHAEELEKANDSTRAEAQVRAEIDRERAGEPPTLNQLLGTWVFDGETTLDVMLGGMAAADRAKMAAEIFAKIGKPSYTFGPGNRVEVRSQGPDGKEKVELALFRLDGATVHLKAEGRTREESLKAGIRQGKLILGSGFGMVAFSRN